MDRDYEDACWKTLLEWRTEEPGLFARASHEVAVGIPVPLRPFVSEKVLGNALAGVDALARKTARPDAVLESAGADSLEDLRTRPLQECDALAKQVQIRAMAMAAAEGAATGTTGIAGLAADVPLIMTLLLRTVYQTGFCYGHDAEAARDRNMTLSVLAITMAGTTEERQRAASLLTHALDDSGIVLDHKSGMPATDHSAGEVLIGQVLRQAGLNLLKRKVFQTIPILGSVAGASINTLLARELCINATRVCQETWFAINRPDRYRRFETSTLREAQASP